MILCLTCKSSSTLKEGLHKQHMFSVQAAWRIIAMHATLLVTYSSTSYVDWRMRPFECIAKLENTYVVSCRPSHIVSRLNVFKWELTFQGTGKLTFVKWISAFILEHLHQTVKYYCLVFWRLNIEYMPLAFEYFHFAFECLGVMFELLHLVLEYSILALK